MIRQVCLASCFAGLSAIAASLCPAADWQTADWHVVPSSSDALQRAAPIRNLVATANGTLLGTRTTGSTVQLLSSSNNGIDWDYATDIVANPSLQFGDPTLTVTGNGDILAAYRLLHPTAGWSIRMSRSTDGGQSWNVAGTIHNYTGTAGEFVGAPHFNTLSDGTLQVYYDSEFAAPGGNQYIAVKDGVWDDGSSAWSWTNERIVNTTAIGGAAVRDGLATVVNLGPDLDGAGDRLMVVTEAVGTLNGQGYNLIRAFQVENGGATQADWDNLLDSRVIYQSPLTDPQGHSYNAYAPYALRVGDGPVVVAFSTDEVLATENLPADLPSAAPRKRHSEIKFIQTTDSFESWSAPTTLWGVDHPEFVGDANSGDIYNYQIGLLELSSNDLLATLDMFDGKQLVFRPSLGGNTADFDESGLVDGADLLIWQRGVGLTGQTSTTTGDATGEGNVDAADLALWQQQYGGTTDPAAAGTSVPEPATAALALVAVLTLAVVPTRRRSWANRP
ncbi:MAG: hypothetical protein CMJ58_01970 [Planctomycetaceae bacterium]|nr:hypothetical protein [Planctomycetaceae bacterium]